jgi:hypothetical protein
LHLLGSGHTKLIHRFHVRDFRLTDAEGNTREEAAGVKVAQVSRLQGMGPAFPARPTTRDSPIQRDGCFHTGD